MVEGDCAVACDVAGWAVGMLNNDETEFVVVGASVGGGPPGVVEGPPKENAGFAVADLLGVAILNGEADNREGFFSSTLLPNNEGPFVVLPPPKVVLPCPVELNALLDDVFVPNAGFDPAPPPNNGMDAPDAFCPVVVPKTPPDAGVAVLPNALPNFGAGLLF